MLRGDRVWPRVIDTSTVFADPPNEAGPMRAPTVDKGLGLGDRTCSALAREPGLPAVTTDRARAELANDLKVELVVVR